MAKSIICPQCKCEVHHPTSLRCPRCNALLITPCGGNCSTCGTKQSCGREK